MKLGKWRAIVAAAIVAASGSILGTVARAEDASNVLFIFDSSGSMKKKLPSGETRFAVAQRSMAESLATIPSDVHIGLMLYGHRKAKDCTDIELVSPIGADDAATIAKTIQGLKPKGETPIADALKMAARNFAALKGQANRIVLVTDGIEECKGDPCAAAQAVKDAGLDLVVDVVGFTLTDKQAKAVQCIADLTGGTYYDAGDMKGLTGALTQVAQKVAAPPPAISLIDVNRGGQLLTASNDLWSSTNDGKPDWITWFRSGEEAVYAFKDEAPATFDAFTVLIDKADNGNLKEFELLAGNDGPGGPFESIGFFTTQNLKMMKTPYQEFKFAPVTARYLKVRLLSNHGGDGYIGVSEFQLIGEVSGTAPAAQQVAAAAPAAINLLDPLKGGQLLAAPSDVWQATNDGKPNGVTWLRANEEGVFGFKDDRPATFDTFAVLIPATSAANLKEAELLVGDEGPTGAFRSIGTFTTQNLKMMKTPFQAFKFEPVTARYLKVRLVSNHGGDGYIEATEFQLLGQLGEAAAPQQAAVTPKPSAFNLLEPARGGQLVTAPNDVWQSTNDGKPQNVTWMRANEEGVYAFKDDAPATFDTFKVFIGGTDPGNLKEFELLAGSDGPAGPFQSIGTFTTQNLKLVKDPYQAFTFAPVTARFVKVRLVSNHGNDGYIAASEFQLIGELGEAAPATQQAAAAAAPTGSNLLASGQLMAAPNDVWAATVDGKTDNVLWMQAGQEGVYAFKSEAAATFDSFAVYIGGADPGNLKEFELLAGDEGPTGAFVSIGNFTTQNLKVVANPYQQFTFAPVTARYLKVKLVSNHGGDGYIAASEFQLFGTLEP